MDYMEYIQNAVDDAWEELHGAKHYAEIACKMKDNDPSSVSMFSDMAKQELQHAEKLMVAAGRLSNSSGDATIKKSLDLAGKQSEGQARRDYSQNQHD